MLLFFHAHSFETEHADFGAGVRVPHALDVAAVGLLVVRRLADGLRVAQRAHVVLGHPAALVDIFVRRPRLAEPELVAALDPRARVRRRGRRRATRARPRCTTKSTSTRSPRSPSERGSRVSLVNEFKSPCPNRT